MKSLSISQVRPKLYQLLDEAPEPREPIKIIGKRANSVSVSVEDWRSIQETLHLISIPGMLESIRAGMAQPLGQTSTNPGW